MISNLFATPAMKPIRKDLRALADDASRLAHSQLMDPAMKSFRETRDAMMKRASQAEHYTAQQCDRIAQQITTKPFTAIMIAFAAGWVVSRVFGLGKHE